MDFVRLISKRNFLLGSAFGLVLAQCNNAAAETITLSSKLTKFKEPIKAEILENILREISLTGATAVLDKRILFSGTLKIPAGTKLIGISQEQSVLIHDGSGTAIDITAPCHLDNIVVDGGRTTTDRTKSRTGSLIAAHGIGSIDGMPASRLSGLSIGRLKVVNTDCSAALVLANLDRAEIGQIEFENCWGNALLIFGLENSRVGSVKAKDIGNLAASGTRQGSAVAVFSERTSGKSPGVWYQSGSEAETEHLHFGKIESRATTDTAVYVHGYPDGASVRDVTFDEVDIDGAGKDGLKIRYYSSRVTVRRANIRNIALRGLSIEESTNINIDEVSISGAGRDLAPLAGISPVTSEIDTSGQSIMAQPGGILVLKCKSVAIRKAALDDIRKSPISQKYGVAINIIESAGISLAAKVGDSEGESLFARDVSDSDISIDARAAPRPPTDVIVEGIGRDWAGTRITYSTSKISTDQILSRRGDTTGLYFLVVQ